MLVPWLIVKSVLTLSILGVIAGGSYLITTHPPSPVAPSVISIQIEANWTCNHADCSGHGDCEVREELNASFVCVCDELYYGGMCEEHCPNLCSGVGTCKTHNDTTNITSMYLDVSGNVSCQCPHNYAGVGCEVTCNCTENGRCGEGGQCVCAPGYSGKECEVWCGGDCGNGWCTDTGVCQCDQTHYGAQCDKDLKICSLSESDIIVKQYKDVETDLTHYAKEFQFGEECDTDSRYEISFEFVSGSGTPCVGVVQISEAKNTFLYMYGQDDAAVVPGNASEGLLFFDSRATCGYISIQIHHMPNEIASFFLNASCIPPVQASTLCYKQPCELSLDGGTGKENTLDSDLLDNSHNNRDYTYPPSPSHSFLEIDGSWTPAAPHINILAQAAYYRPDILSENTTNNFALGLGWLTIVVAIVCCITFLALCLRPPRSRELSSLSTEGSFCEVLVREMKSRHAVVSLCNTSAESVLNLPAKFLLLFLHTFFNLALSAMWFGQHSVGEMFSSTLITASCVFVVMQLMRFCLRGAHLRNEWYIPIISYTAPLVLAVWSAYTTGLYVLEMSEDEAHFFLIRAVCSFILQHTIFFAVSTAVIVWVKQWKTRTKGTATIQPLPEV